MNSETISEAVGEWLREPISIRSIAVSVEIGNNSSEPSFLDEKELCAAISRLQLQVCPVSFWRLLFRRKLFVQFDVLLRLKYSQTNSTVGYVTVVGTRSTSSGWITKDQITGSSNQSGSTMKHALEATISFSVEDANGLIFRGEGANKTFPETLPSWLSPTDVHRRTMQEATDYLFGSLSAMSQQPGVPALYLLAKYGKQRDWILAALTSKSAVAREVVEFLKLSTEEVLKACWHFWAEGIRDPRPAARDSLLNFLKSPPVSILLNSGAVALWGNYCLAKLAASNPSVMDSLLAAAEGQHAILGMRAAGVLSINNVPAAERRLLDIAKSPDWQIKEMACFNILRYGNPSLLRRMAVDQDPGVRRLLYRNIRTLSQLSSAIYDFTWPDDPAADDVKTLLICTDADIMGGERGSILEGIATRTLLDPDPSADVRLEAAHAIGELWDGRPDSELLEVLAKVSKQDQNVGVRDSAHVIIQRLRNQKQ